MSPNVNSNGTPEPDVLARMASLSVHAGASARASVVNRTHRVVRERAAAIEARKSVTRSLWIPLGVCAGLLGAVVFAIWTVLEEYDLPAPGLAANGLPDASQQIFVLLMWCVPLSLAALAVILLRRGNATPGNESGNEGA